MLRALLELSRISNLPTVWTNVLAAWIIANQGWKSDSRLAWLLLGASLIYSAGMILNDVFDAAWDRDHRPERPIPSGRFGFKAALVVGLGGLFGGAAIMVLFGGAGFGWTLALVLAVLAYDLYHKPWAGSIIVMGACRTLLYCAAASAVGGAMLVLQAGVLLGLYIVALTRTARAEASGKVGHWTRVALTVMLFLPAIVALLSNQVTAKPSTHVLIVAPAFLAAVAFALKKMRQGGPAIGQAVGWMLAAIPAVDALAVARFSLPIALGFVLTVPVLRVWQRYIAAT